MKKEAVKKEEYEVLPEDLLRDIARLKGRAAPGKAVPVATSILYPVSAAIAAEERRKEEEARRKAELIGQEIPGHGIYIGTWEPEGLSRKFNIFAAPEDLTNEAGQKALFKYVDAVRRIASLTNWHGHRGMNYKTDKDLYKALADGSYMKHGSGWFIPPFVLLTGTKANEQEPGLKEWKKVFQPDNLYDHRNAGVLKDTFNKKDSFYDCAIDAGVYPGNYWSSTEGNPIYGQTYVWEARLRDRWQEQTAKNINPMSCRPIRLEPVP